MADAPTVPDFAPYFDVKTPLPGERSPAFKGYVLGLPEEKYQAFPGVNASVLKEPTACEMLHCLTKPRESGDENKDLVLGKLLHWAVLEQWRFAEPEKHMMLCDTKGLDTKAADAQRKANPGLLLVTPELVDGARECMAAVQANPKAMALLSGRDPDDDRSGPAETAREASGFVWDGHHAIWRKMRLDLLPANRNYLLDVKTTSRPLFMFRTEALKFGYFIQAAWYLHTHFLLTGELRQHFRWIVVNKKAPFMCRTFYMRNLRGKEPLYDDSLLKAARERIGLEPSERISRLHTFLQSARETEQLRQRVPLTAASLRNLWSGYEQESPEAELLI